MSAVLFLFWLCVLLFEGSCIAIAVTKEKHALWLTLPLALPIAALSNVLLVFLYTVIHVPLFWWTLLIGHACVIIAAAVIASRHAHGQVMLTSQAYRPLFSSAILNVLCRCICVVILAAELFFSVAHAVILPTYNIDSLTNWTMRSEVSFYDHAIAFDTTEARGVAKPQYPFLFHALQVTVNQGEAVWNDRAANTILFLLTLSSFAALFLLIHASKGIDHALIAISVILSIPLLMFHLAEGYADIHLTTYLLLSFVTLYLYRERREKRWLILSALFVAAASWTKTEGFVIGLVPWIVLAALDLIKSTIRKPVILSIILALLLTLPFPIFLLFKGLTLTPHASDTSISWHSDAFATAFNGLFAGGSMGVTWYAIVIGLLLHIWLYVKRDPRIDRQAMILCGWGLFAFAAVFFTYIFTPNAGFLENGESYYRQLMAPGALLILWSVLVWNKIGLEDA